MNEERWRLLAVLLSALILAGACASSPRFEHRTLDAIASQYVQLQLGIAVHDPIHIAWYFGPPELRAQAESQRLPIATLKRTADQLLNELNAMAPGDVDAQISRRREFLIEHLRAARLRLDMLTGRRVSFDEEARQLYGITPKLQPLESYDAVIERIDRLLPGADALAARVEDFRKRYAIPADRLHAVMSTAIAECQRRTAAHMSLPSGDAFSLELVRGHVWSGNNLYLGEGRGTIQINTDFPVGIDRAVELACHEGYPGHHTHMSLLDARLVQGKGWVEHSVVPIFGPISFLVEAEASYAPFLAFPGEERVNYERTRLYELAGLDPAAALHVAEVREALGALAGARLTIGRMLLDGQIEDSRALDLLERYQLVTRAYAGQILSFMKTYRSYIINYGLGEPELRSYLQRLGDQDAQWRAMERLLSEPTLPVDFAQP